MASKSLSNIVNQLQDAETGSNEGFNELSPEEAEELAGGAASDVGLNGACGNRGCPTTNQSCGKTT